MTKDNKSKFLKLINKKIRELKQLQKKPSWGLSQYGNGQLDVLLELKKEFTKYE